jgi:hypothetical protein
MVWRDEDPTDFLQADTVTPGTGGRLAEQPMDASQFERKDYRI